MKQLFLSMASNLKFVSNNVCGIQLSKKRINMITITNILEATNLENIEGYLLATDFKKTFDFLDHNLLITILEKYEFGHEFVD